MDARGKRWLPAALLAITAAAVLLLAGPAIAEEHVEEDEAHLLVQIDNEGGQDRDINVSVDGPTTWARDVTVDAGEIYEHRLPGPTGAYEITVSADTWATLHVDNRGCKGPHLVPFSLQQDGNPSAEQDECLGQPARFNELVAEAFAARGAEGEQAIDVPHPLDASTGQWLRALDLGEPQWENATEVPFRWIPNASFVDGWGREVQGTMVDGDRPPISESRLITQVGNFSSQAQVDDQIRYVPDDWRPIATTEPVSGFSTVTPVGTSAEVHWEVRYDSRVDPMECLYRNPLQGTQLSAGQTMENVFCPDAELGEDEAWWTGPVEEHRGFATIALYAVNDPGNPTLIVKVVFADGIPHPINGESFAFDPDGNDHTHTAWNLSHFSPEGTPLDELETTSLAAPSIDEDVQRPLEGPRLEDDARVPFPLEEAVDAARQDPTLLELQGLFDEGGVLAGAQMAPGWQTDGQAVRELTWTLAFTTPEHGPLFVECRRPASSTSQESVAAPVAYCSEQDEAPSGAQSIAEVPQVGVDDLAARSTTWDEALQRWSLVDPANASAPLTLASYRPALRDQASQPEQAPEEARGRLEVGTDGGGSASQATNTAEVPSTVTIAAGDGSTIAYRTGAKESQILAPGTPLEESENRAPDDEQPDGGLLAGDRSKLVVGTAGAGILGLLGFALFSLYSRLTEKEVLSHDTRRAIRDLLEANPGMYERAIAREVDANERTVEHHLRILVREEVLVTLQRGGYTHYFLQGRHPPKQMQALASLQRGRAEQVYEIVRQDPGVDVSTLAESAEISKPYASKLVSQLVDVGLVDKVREGRRSMLYANEV